MSTYKIGQFAKLVRRTPATIRRWEAEGKIASKRLPSGHRYYDDADLQAVLGVKPERKLTVVYCRVSSRGQKADLQRQLEAMEMWALGSGTAVDEWITEIGGGMNFKRPQFLKLLDRISTGEVGRLIVAHNLNSRALRYTEPQKNLRLLSMEWCQRRAGIPSPCRSASEYSRAHLACRAVRADS